MNAFVNDSVHTFANACATAVVNAFIQNPDGSLKLAGASYFYFFAGLMFVTAVLFLLVLKYYTPTTYLHEEK